MAHVGVYVERPVRPEVDAIGLLACSISFLFICVVGHACVLEAPVTRSTVGLFHALSALSIAAGGIELLR
jgi:hypothetical protein